MRLTGAAALTPVLRAQVSPVTARLAGYMAEAASRPLPSEVVEKAKQHILDTLAAMISGSELPPGKVALKYARARAGEQSATVVCSNVLTGAPEAALVNGMLAHSDETDDSHAPSQSHPGCSVVSAALAAGDAPGAGVFAAVPPQAARTRPTQRTRIG